MDWINRNFFYQLIYSLSQVIFPLFTYPYVTRILGPENLGKVSFIDYAAGLIVTIASFGIPIYGVRKIAQVRDNPGRLQKTFSEILTIHLLITIICIVPYLVILYLKGWFISEQVLTLLGGVSILLNSLMADWFFQGIEAFKYITRRTILLRIAGAVSVFLLVKNSNDFTVYYLISIVVQFVITVINFINVKKIINRVSFGDLEVIPHFKPLLNFFLTSSFISFFVFFDTIILGFLTNETAVGYYTTALKLVKLSLVFILALNSILFPHISRIVANREEERIRELLSKSFDFIFFISFPACFFFYFLSEDIITLVAGNAFVSSSSTMQLLSPLPLIWGLNNTLIFQVLIPYEREKNVVFIVGIASLINLFSNYLLITNLGHNGAAIAALITELFILLFAVFYANKTLRLPFFWKDWALSLIASIVLIPVFLLFQNSAFSKAVILLNSILFGGVLYLILQYFLFRNKSLLFLFGLAKLKKS